MQPCNLLKPLPQSSRYSKNVYQGMHNEKCNKSSFYLPLLFNFYLLSYAFLLAKKKSQRKKHEEKHRQVALLVCPFWSGGYMTGHARLKTVHVYKPQRPSWGSSVFFSHNASPLIVNR